MQMYTNSFANDQHQPGSSHQWFHVPYQKGDGAYLNVLIVGEMDLLLSNQYYFDQESIKLTRLQLLE